KMKKKMGNKCRQVCREIKTLIHCWWKSEIMQPLWKIVWKFLRELEFPQKNIGLLCDLVIPLLGIHPKQIKTLMHKDIGTPMFTAVLFTIAKTQKQPRCPSIGEWIKQM
ncbi:LORF2 protein, partial [Crocuta crocuta]